MSKETLKPKSIENSSTDKEILEHIFDTLHYYYNSWLCSPHKIVRTQGELIVVMIVSTGNGYDCWNFHSGKKFLTKTYSLEKCIIESLLCDMIESLKRLVEH